MGGDTIATSIRIEQLFSLASHAMKAAVRSTVNSKEQTTLPNPTDCVRRSRATVAQSSCRLQTKPHG